MQTGKAYSMDLRERVIAVYQEGKMSMQEVAKRFAVSRSWVNNLVQRQKQTGSVAAKPHGGGAVAKVTATHYPILEAIIDSKNDLTLLEISQKLAEKTGILVSQSTICRALQEIELTRKKKLFMLTSKKVRQSNS
jgi:transposase